MGKSDPPLCRHRWVEARMSPSDARLIADALDLGRQHPHMFSEGDLERLRFWGDEFRQQGDALS